MNFKRTVLVTAVVVAVVAWAGSGDKTLDVLIGYAEAASPAPTQAEETATPVLGVENSKVEPAPPPQQDALEKPASVVVPKSTPSAAAAVKPVVARGPITLTLDGTPRTFAVTVDVKDPEHPSYGHGANLGFVIDGVPGKELALSRGVTYTFAVRTGIQHDFYFTTSPIGHGAGTVTEGVVGQFTYNGDAKITPTASTPAVMYYECRNHKYMGGKIHVGNVGEKVVLGVPDSSDTKTAEVKRAVSTEQVKQKLNFAEVMIGTSSAAKRVAASNHTEAKQFVAQAKQELVKARGAMDMAKNNDAMSAVDEALRLMHSAATLVPDETATSEDKERYRSMLEQIRGFEASYQRNVSRGMKPKGGAELDKNKFSRTLSEAENLAGKGQYGEAVKQLESANELLTAALTAMLDSQIMVYEKNFATPKDEYEHELSRYASYSELVPVAIEQNRPLPQTIAMMEELTKRANEIRDEALGLAKQSDYKMAILALQAATERVQKALRLAGVQ